MKIILSLMAFALFFACKPKSSFQGDSKKSKGKIPIVKKDAEEIEEDPQYSQDSIPEQEGAYETGKDPEPSPAESPPPPEPAEPLPDSNQDPLPQSPPEPIAPPSPPPPPVEVEEQAEPGIPGPDGAEMIESCGQCLARAQALSASIGFRATLERAVNFKSYKKSPKENLCDIHFLANMTDHIEAHSGVDSIGARRNQVMVYCPCNCNYGMDPEDHRAKVTGQRGPVNGAPSSNWPSRFDQ